MPSIRYTVPVVSAPVRAIGNVIVDFFVVSEGCVERVIKGIDESAFATGPGNRLSASQLAITAQSNSEAFILVWIDRMDFGSFERKSIEKG